MSNIGTKFNLADRFTFDPNTNTLIDTESDSELIRLGSNESRILLLMCEKPSEIVSRNELHDFVWRKQGFEVDDSSLTQAISTLRKLLKDQTKSPMFVKTVPKRGYQLICSVERTSPLMSGELDSQELLDELENTPSSTFAESPTNDLRSTASPEPQSEVKTQEADKLNISPKLVTRLLILLAILLPVCVVLFTNPAQSTFRQIAIYDGIPVKTPINHPELTTWYPSIEQCVTKYKLNHTGDRAPVEVIATGGQNNQLVLNYIHSIQQSGENITLRIFASEENLNKVCL
jgi:cholera toxin transcriptional activator